MRAIPAGVEIGTLPDGQRYCVGVPPTVKEGSDALADLMRALFEAPTVPVNTPGPLNLDEWHAAIDRAHALPLEPDPPLPISLATWRRLQDSLRVR